MKYFCSNRLEGYSGRSSLTTEASAYNRRMTTLLGYESTHLYLGNSKYLYPSDLLRECDGGPFIILNNNQHNIVVYNFEKCYATMYTNHNIQNRPTEVMISI